jgi:peptidyl-prolyl cis-trans isomerase C
MSAQCIASIVLLAAGAAGQGAAIPSTRQPAVVVEARGLTVTVDELRDAVVELRRTAEPAALAETLSPEGLERIALRVLERKVLARAARDAGLDRVPDVERAITTAADTLLARALVDREILSIGTTDAALRRYYDTHQAAFHTGARRRAHHVVVATRADAEAALAEIRAGKPIAEVASARNIDATKTRSGDLGWVSRGVMVTAFDAALFALQAPGDLSGIVQTSFGFHVIRLDEIDPGRLQPFEAVRAQVRQAARDEAAARLKRDLSDKYRPSVNKDALARFEK